MKVCSVQAREAGSFFSQSPSRIFTDMVGMKSFLFFTVIVSLWSRLGAEKCLSGPYHRNNSAPGGQGFVECLGYKDNACCTGELTQKIKYHPETLYNFTWHHCRKISKGCLRYLVNEECFYQCDPSLIQYQRQGRPDAVQNVPICSDYCDKWFNACQNEMTCVQNWESGFVKVGKHYACPNKSKCHTFKEVYKNAAGLCNKMWGVSFYYHNKNQSCYRMGEQESKAKGIGCILLPQIYGSFLISMAVFVMVSLALSDA